MVRDYTLREGALRNAIVAAVIRPSFRRSREALLRRHPGAGQCVCAPTTQPPGPVSAQPCVARCARRTASCRRWRPLATASSSRRRTERSGLCRWRTARRAGRRKAVPAWSPAVGTRSTFGAKTDASPASLPRTGRSVWTAETGVTGRLPVGRDDELVFVAGQGLAALVAETGALRWKSGGSFVASTPPCSHCDSSPRRDRGRQAPLFRSRRAGRSSGSSGRDEGFSLRRPSRETRCSSQLATDVSCA